MAPRMNLGRVVIILGGLLVFAALASQVFAGERPWMWTAVFGGLAASFAATFFLGRAAGGWLAARQGGNLDEGRRSGVVWAYAVFTIALSLVRWFGLI